MKISEIMSWPVVATSPHASIRDALFKMRDHDVGALPVVEDGVLVGMLTDRDVILGALPGTKPNTPVRELMTADPLVCYADDDVMVACARMGDWQVRRLPVLNRARRLVGVLSLSDVAVGASEELAGQVLGEICEEHAPPARRPGERVRSP